MKQKKDLEDLKDKLIMDFIIKCENNENIKESIEIITKDKKFDMEEQIIGISIDKEFNYEKMNREKKGMFIL
jgi:hypothetical protein